MLFQSEELDAGDVPDLKGPAGVLCDLLDNADSIRDMVGGDSYYEMEAMLGNAICDREALLTKLGLTDSQWSMQGGACWADLER